MSDYGFRGLLNILNHLSDNMGEKTKNPNSNNSIFCSPQDLK